jgi:hypothetical protein
MRAHIAMHRHMAMRRAEAVAPEPSDISPATVNGFAVIVNLI